MPYQIYLGFIRLPLMLRTFIIAISSIMIFGILIHLVEPNHFPEVFDGIWWAIITASTVGFGDYVPHSIIGRLLGILLILTSAGFLSTFFVSLATAAAIRQNDHIEGKVRFKGKDHLIIIGWNQRSREIIYSLLNEKNPMSITLIDETLTENPFEHNLVHFIQGPPNQDEVLTKANILLAKKIIITADPQKDELQADMYTIITLLAVKGLNPEVETIVEILTNEQIANANRAGADEIIQTNILTSFVMLQSVTSQDIVTSFLDMLYQLSEKKVAFQQVDTEQIERNFSEISVQFIQSGKILIGIKRGDATILNPPKPFIIEKNDQLIIIR